MGYEKAEEKLGKELREMCEPKCQYMVITTPYGVEFYHLETCEYCEKRRK